MRKGEVVRARQGRHRKAERGTEGKKDIQKEPPKCREREKDDDGDREL